MTIVSAYSNPGWVGRPDLEGIKGKSFDELFTHLKEGDHATVEVGEKGYKEISIEDGQQFIQRNFAYDY